MNKHDLDPDPRLKPEDIDAFFEKRKWPWSYSSAKTGAGVEEGFRRIVELVLKDRPAA
jgi:hypothetical protein